jgi:hypothetical protein
MPRLNLTYKADEITFDVWVGPPLHTIMSGQAAAQMLTVRAELDTGCTATAVSERILQALGLTPSRLAKTTTASGIASTDSYFVSIGIPAGDQLTTPHTFDPFLEVTALPAWLTSVDVLFGMNLIRLCQLFIDGPSGHATLDF